MVILNGVVRRLNKCESVSKPAGSLHDLGMTISILDWITAHKDRQWASRTAARWPFTPERLAYTKSLREN